MLSRPEAGNPNSLQWIRADFPEEPPFKNNTNKTYLVNLKTETAKGQRRAKNTSPLPNRHFSLVFLFPALSGSPSSPLSTGQHQESHTPPPGAVLPWHLGDYLPRSQPRHSASCWSTLRSTFCAKPLLVPIPLSSVPDGTGSSLIAAGRWQEWVRWPKSPLYSDISRHSRKPLRSHCPDANNNSIPKPMPEAEELLIGSDLLKWTNRCSIEKRLQILESIYLPINCTLNMR